MAVMAKYLEGKYPKVFNPDVLRENSIAITQMC
jgi:hypothetical protein